MKELAERYKLLLELSPSQALAIEVIDRGGSHAEAAQAAGVDRTTVSRWATKHPAFVAEISNRRLERARESEQCLRELDRKAAAAIADGIEKGDTSLSLQWFKIRGGAKFYESPFSALDPITIIDRRAASLPGTLESLIAKSEGRTVRSALEQICKELEGYLDLGETDLELPEWEEFLELSECEEFEGWEQADFESLVEEFGIGPDIDDPLIRAELERLDLLRFLEKGAADDPSPR